MNQTFEAGSRPTFRERVAALCGVSGWREPTEGHTTRVKPIPAAHLVAAALSFGRRGPDDVGPDIAFDIAMERTGHDERVLRWLIDTMLTEPNGRAERSGAVGRHPGLVPMVAALCYRRVVLGAPMVPAPEGVTDKDWGELVLTACLLLEYAAEDALALAERRAREVA